MAEIEVGIGKSARRAYGLDDIVIVPSRRTRAPEEVDTRWEIDAYTFTMPILASAIDSVTSPKTAIEMSRLGGVGVLNLEGLWTRYEDPDSVFEEISKLSADKATVRMQQLYEAPIQETLIAERIQEIRDAGATAAASLTPQKVEQFSRSLADAELDIFVIQGTVVSAEHVAKTSEPLNLKRFIREFDIPTLVGGCASYHAALHLMRTGAAGILVGVGLDDPHVTRGTLGLGVPQATAIADARGARMRHLDETGVYVHVIANGGIRTAGDIAKSIVCGADAVMMEVPLAAAHEAPGRGHSWSMEMVQEVLPRGSRSTTSPRGTLEQILQGPAPENDGRLNLMGSLKASMANCGYETLKDFQKADVMVVPSSDRLSRDFNSEQGAQS